MGLDRIGPAPCSGPGATQLVGLVGPSPNRVARLHSAASRLLQLADVLAYSRKWIVSAELNAAGLREWFEIQLP
jgi:hypothetical protein